MCDLSVTVMHRFFQIKQAEEEKEQQGKDKRALLFRHCLAVHITSESANSAMARGWQRFFVAAGIGDRCPSPLHDAVYLSLQLVVRKYAQSHY